MQVERQLYLLRGPLGVMAGRLLDQERAVVADHPYRLYLESLAVPRDKAARVLDQLIEHLDVTNLQLRSYVMFQALEKSKNPGARVAGTLALKHVDNTAYDLSELVRSTGGRDQSNNALTVLEVSPHSQYAKAVLIEKDWERACAPPRGVGEGGKQRAGAAGRPGPAIQRSGPARRRPALATALRPVLARSVGVRAAWPKASRIMATWSAGS